MTNAIKGYFMVSALKTVLVIRSTISVVTAHNTTTNPVMAIIKGTIKTDCVKYKMTMTKKDKTPTMRNGKGTNFKLVEEDYVVCDI